MVCCRIEQIGTGCTISGCFTEKELAKFIAAGWFKVENLQEADYQLGSELEKLAQKEHWDCMGKAHATAEEAEEENKAIAAAGL